MHTKGPWKMLYLQPYRLISVVGGKDNTGMEDGTSVIAEIQPSGLPFSALHPDEIEANARLIAAAPELLEELEKAMDWLTTNNPTGLMLHEMGDEIKRAIRKAKGE